jgi:hypothetical protein
MGFHQSERARLVRTIGARLECAKQQRHRLNRGADHQLVFERTEGE